MEKPPAFIRIEESSDFEWGVLVIGPVAIPVWIPTTAYIIALVVSLIFSFGAFMGNPDIGWAAFIPFAWVAGPAVALILLMIIFGVLFIVVDDIMKANGRRWDSK